MSTLRFTLITDGSSDRVLLNIIKWILNDVYPKLSTEGAYADFRQIKNPPSSNNIVERVKVAADFYPFDILFYHRDAESTAQNILVTRHNEILNELEQDQQQITVCVVPIVMMESWLLIDQDAIKKAAGNRQFKGQLRIPALNRLESCRNPKDVLHASLKEASGLKGRNLRKFNEHSAVHLVSEYIQDYKHLRHLVSFQRLEADLKKVVDQFLQKEGE